MKESVLRFIWFTVLTLLWLGAASAGPIGLTSYSGGMLYGTGGEVTVFFRGSDAAYDSFLWLDGVSYFPNHSTAPGTLVSLGVIQAYTPIPFRLKVVTSGDEWFIGPAGSNADQLVHAAITRWSADALVSKNGFLIGWEDLPGQSDFDYNDHEFVVSGVTDNPTPEPATFLLFGTALVATGFLRLRRRR